MGNVSLEQSVHEPGGLTDELNGYNWQGAGGVKGNVFIYVSVARCILSDQR